MTIPHTALRQAWAFFCLTMGWRALCRHLGPALLALPLSLAPTTGRAAVATDCPQPPQASAADLSSLQPKTARDRGFLWRIQKGGHTSYLFGTLHVARVEWIMPGPQTQAALRASGVIALELDMLDPDIVHRLQTGIAEAARHALPEAVEERLRQQMKKACIGDDALEQLSPEMMVNTLIILAARRLGLDPSYGIDTLLAGMARGLHKETHSLETPEAQIALLHGQNEAETLALVESGLNELEGNGLAQQLQRLAGDWADSNLDDLAAYPRWCDCENTDEEKEAQKRMLDERNPGMAQQIDALHGKGRNVFAAVGSLHMIGPQGLPALMAARGYKVERVCFAR